MRIALVNATSLVEKIIRNILQEDHSFLAMQAKDIESSLMKQVEGSGPITKAENKAESIVRGKLENAKKEIEALLDGNSGSAPPTPQYTVYSKTILPVFEADFIFYHINGNEEQAQEHLRQLRRSCGFRDVPILILTDLMNIDTAHKLVGSGATDALQLPVMPETLKGRIDKLMRPVGMKMPILTKLINPFISATLDLMSTMANLQVTRKELFLKKNYRLFGDISGIMNFSGKINGAVVVSFNEDLACEIVGRILGTAPETITSEELKDGVGEIINIISGNAKALLSGTEFGHEITLPAVVTGMGHEIRHPQNAPCIVVIFEASGRPFAIQVSMMVNQ